MSFITVDNLIRINFELTDYCNAACPMCARHNWDGSLKKFTNKNHTTLQFIKDKISLKILGQLQSILSCGTYGDAIMNPECLEIYEYFRKNNNNSIELFTNGGARNKDFWSELAKLNIVTTFSIDGLEDTNHLYRRNVKWSKLFENMKTYRDHGGKAVWEFLIFKHNEHQIEEARALSKKLGFLNFRPKHTGRWKDYSDMGEYRDTDRIAVDDYYLEKPESQNNPEQIENVRPLRYFKDKEEIYKKIICDSFRTDNIEIYIRANGIVSPCCWLGDTKIHEAKRLIENHDENNLHHTDLDTILKGEFFKKLDKGIHNSESQHRLNTCYSCCGVK
jgi:MoaA/NifB/PqqE/SkfB family radical SAM enzyme